MAETELCSNPAEEKMTDLLGRLALLSGLKPRSSLLSDSPPPSPPSSPAPGTDDSPRQRKKKTSLLRFCSKLFKRKTQSDSKSESKTKTFPKGTGYSVRKDDGWDVKAFVTDQGVKERHVVSVLQEILGELRGQAQYNNHRVRSDEMFSLLEGSVLVPFLESKLERPSFLDICQHPAVYEVIISLLGEFCARPGLARLLAPLPGQTQSLHSLLLSLESQASSVTSKIGHHHHPVTRDFLQLSQQVTEALKTEGLLPIRVQVRETESSGAACDGEELKYRKALSVLQYDSIDFTDQVYLRKIVNTDLPTRRTTVRIAQELCSLTQAETLPCSLSSSIFVRSDDSKMSLLKAVITGPSDTPYSGGVYEFDIFLPIKHPGYPSLPPKVKFRTTGGGRVRFNPNLYKDGKVCLSLLGTWPGAQGEQWSKQISTIIQVLISIQSLILVPEPYYNEPWLIKTPKKHKADSHLYNRSIFISNLRCAILEQLRSPPEGFRDVVRAHFFYRRNSLIKELEAQAKQYFSTSIDFSYIQMLLEEVKMELLKIEKPED